MSPENFCYWLKGFFELIDVGPKNPDKLVLTADQVEMIEKHLKSVFQEKIMNGATTDTIIPYKVAEQPPPFYPVYPIPTQPGTDYPFPDNTKFIC